MKFQRIKYFFDVYVKRYSHVDIARKMGVKVGTGCSILSNPYTCFSTEPYLVEIGDYVRITAGVRFHTHDGAVWVLRNLYNLPKIDMFGKIKVGNNVFIGTESIILPNVEIGDNVIIGSGAIVTKNIPNEEVWGGCPARKLCSIEEFYEKHRDDFLETCGKTEEEKRHVILRHYGDNG